MKTFVKIQSESAFAVCCFESICICFRPFSDSDDGIVFEQDNNDDDTDWLDAEDSKKCNQDGKEVMTAQAPKLQFLYIQVQKPHLSCKKFDNFPHHNLHDFLPTSCRKVMFLQLSVSHSVHRKGCTPPQADTTPDRYPRTDPPQSATEVGGTHPTGMHSC